MNVKAKPMFIKEEGIYKIIDDFRKIKLFEINCAPSCSHYRTSLGNIRQNWVGNIKVATALNGGLLKVEDMNADFFRDVMNFDYLSSVRAHRAGIYHQLEDIARSVKRGPSGDSATLNSSMAGQREVDSLKRSEAIDHPQLTQEADGGSSIGKINATMSQSVQVTPPGSSLRRMMSQQVKRMSEKVCMTVKSTECTHMGPCDKIEFVSCEEYPRSIEVTDFSQMNELRYSCGWRLESISKAGVIRYRYEMFDIHMLYELMVQSLDHDHAIKDQTDCPIFDIADQHLEGMYTVNIMMPSQTRDSKKHIYETIRKEARVWDDIMSLCHLMVGRFNTDWLKDYLKSHRSMVINDLVHNLNDQKAAK